MSHAGAVFISSLRAKRVSWNLPDLRWQAYYQPQASLLLLWKKPFRYCRRRVWTAFLGLCISKKPHNLPSSLCQSHLHSLTGFHPNLSQCSQRQRITQMLSAAVAVAVRGNDKNICDRHTRPFTSLHVSLCQCEWFSQGKPRPRGREGWISPNPTPKKKKKQEVRRCLFSVSQAKQQLLYVL